MTNLTTPFGSSEFRALKAREAEFTHDTADKLFDPPPTSFVELTFRCSKLKFPTVETGNFRVKQELDRMHELYPDTIPEAEPPYEVISNEKVGMIAVGVVAAILVAVAAYFFI